jgi:hypothetical protein
MAVRGRTLRGLGRVRVTALSVGGGAALDVKVEVEVAGPYGCVAGQHHEAEPSDDDGVRLLRYVTCLCVCGCAAGMRDATGVAPGVQVVVAVVVAH